MTDLFLGYPDEGIVNWIKENCVDYSKIPLCFEALEDTSIKLQIDDGSPVEIFLLYSFDNKNWNDWDYETGTDLKVGQKLYIKALHENECMSKYDSNTSNFYTSLFTSLL